MYKIINRAKYIELDTVTGIIPDSKGLELARENGFNTCINGIDGNFGK